MKTFAKHWSRAWIGVLGVTWCLVLTSASAAQAPEITARSVIDRAQIQDLITHYYYNFGKENAESFSDFYADDAELILGTTHYKGKEGIAKAYAPRPGGGGPSQNAYSFNVTISNPLIIVHGDTATSELIFTEYLMDKQGDVPHIRTQGREYATFVKVKGQWRYKSRQIQGGMKPPDGWKE
ncbi:MAG TPA: nuclear transport factor 2 family protein [Steroidobacteraceae bacterium]|jgi:ketosteroid isomerase-like protein